MAQHRILFVCLGNICRSPMAEGVLRTMVEAAGRADDFEIDSAGTGDWHVGNPPDKTAMERSAARGYDISTQRCRQFHADDFERFDLIIGMDYANEARLEAFAAQSGNGDALGRIYRMMSFAKDSTVEEVPDPYFGDLPDYEHALDLIEAACRDMLVMLK